MAGIDRLAEVMGVENDFDPVSQSKFLYEVADEIERIRAALTNARAEERERCARVAEDFEAQVHNTKDELAKYVKEGETMMIGAIYAAKRIAATIRGLNE